MRGQTSAVKTEGGLLPQDLLDRVLAGDEDLPGTEPEQYHVLQHERVGEHIHRSWNRLQGIWQAFREAAAEVDEEQPATALTRNRWLLPLFQELGYGRLPTASGPAIEGKAYPLSHLWNAVPVHLVGANVPLDRRTRGVAGAARHNPHGMVQELLNRSSDHLWAFVSNGRVLRVLRDNHSLTRQAYVEFDLERIFEDELFSDFRLLWLLCHVSRVEGEPPEECWLERWFNESREEGIRALDQLRDGVERAVEALGAGFLRHPENRELQEALRSGHLTGQDYYRELLRVAYRLIFLFVAEDRDLLMDPGADEAARRRYLRFYSTRRVRELAGRRGGSQHSDLWKGLRLVMEKLAEGEPVLALPGYGSFLWREEAIPNLAGAELRNQDLLAAVRELAYLEEDRKRFPVNWTAVGADELGSVYESLLELHPRLDREAATFELKTAAGHERKTTGSYYTPTPLVDQLLDSALEPVLQEAMRSKDPEAALLDLKVCDPAVGSGHFLLAAGRRIATRLAAVRSGDEEPSPGEVTHALRDVVGQCLYGVDVNPMAVELCKVALWMEALEPGKPLTFLENRIVQGNSLLGTTPRLLEEGIPDDAFKAIEGDEKKVVSALKKRNRDERKRGQQTTHAPLLAAEPAAPYGDLRASYEERVEAVPEDSLEAVRRKEERYDAFLRDPEYRRQKLAADAWCAAFVWRKDGTGPEAVTEEVFRQIEHDPDTVSRDILSEVEELGRRYAFFHFHLAFPHVFKPAKEAEDPHRETGWGEGFDVVLGNPPWDQIQLDAREFFATRDPTIASAPNMSKRNALIRGLNDSNPALYEEFYEAQRVNDGVKHFCHNSGRYPKSAFGRLNTAPLFVELKRHVLQGHGRVGVIVPTGIATDSFNQHLFRDLMESEELVCLYDFENRKKIFPEVDSRVKFCLLTVAGRRHQRTEGAEFAFFLQSVRDLEDDERRFVLSSEDLALINPNTRTCPIFRSQKDAEITKGIYRRVPVLVNENEPDGNPWGVEFKLMFMMNTDSHLFRTREELEAEGWGLDGNVFVWEDERCLPLYEAKMTQQYDHRAADVILSETAAARQGQPRALSSAEHQDPTRFPMPRYWVREQEVMGRIPDGTWPALLGLSDVTSTTNERTVLASLLPQAAVGHTMPLVFPQPGAAVGSVPLVAMFNSFVFDYCARQKLGGVHLTFTVLKQLPAWAGDLSSPTPWDPTVSLGEWLGSRVMRLSFTAWDLAELGSRWGLTEPVPWDGAERAKLRAEIDAAFFHLYALSRDEVEYVLESFHIVKRKDEQKYRTFRTKEHILEEYDRLERLSVSFDYSEEEVDEREFVFVPDPPPEERYESFVPLWSVAPAAGAFGEQQLPERQGWVTVPGEDGVSNRLSVARVEGRSMEEEIPDGAYCLFRRPVLHPRPGSIFLVELSGVEDPEHGGQYTVKRFRPREGSTTPPDEQSDHLVGVLESLNPEVPNIEVNAEEGRQMKPIAEFVRVVSTSPPRDAVE